MAEGVLAFCLSHLILRFASLICLAQFNYAMDIWDLYHLEILSLEEEDGHFNPTSDFFEYLPKLSYDYHSRFYEDYIELNPERIDRIRLLFE